MVEKKINLGFVFTSCLSSGPMQQMLNLVSYLDRKIFNPFLITIYEESKNSRLQDFKNLDIPHYFCHLSKIDILLGRTKRLFKLLDDLNLDVIHSMGVFPDYAISKMSTKKQFITLRNYIWDDYPAKYGKLRGFILAKMHLHAMKNATKTVTCSESLAGMYRKGMHLHFEAICNGVELKKYVLTDKRDKAKIREKLNLPSNKLIYVYSGNISPRKNQRFLLDVFRECLKQHDNIFLLLLGDGQEFCELSEKYGNNVNILFKGYVPDVSEYLAASDIYISTSKSEGMPNGVLEAMAAGLPVILSDIPQHKEIFDHENNIGYLYKTDNRDDLERIINDSIGLDLSEFAKNSYELVCSEFSAEKVSKKYQEQYKKIVGWSY